MKKPKGYEEAATLSEREKLPPGGYVARICDAEEVEYSWGNVLVLSIDIQEGEFKDFYMRDYKMQKDEDKKWRGTYRLNVPKDDGSEGDQFTIRVMKTAMEAVEDSNDGYVWNWDEKTLKNKIVGAIFFEKEWEMNGKSGFYTACHSFKPVEDIRSGNFKIPPAKPLKGSNAPAGFVAVADPDGYEGTPFA